MKSENKETLIGWPILRIICGAIAGGIAVCLASAPILLLSFGFIIAGQRYDVNIISALFLVVGMLIGGIAAAKRVWIIFGVLATIGIAGVIILGMLLH